MADLAAIRAGIKVNLSSLETTGVTVGDSTKQINVYEYQPKNPNMPCVMVMGLTDIDYTLGRDSAAVEMSLQAFTSDVIDVQPQVILDTLLFGDTAVKALLEADKTLGGAVEDLFVARNTGHRLLPLQNVKVLGAEWIVTLILTD